ncbi:unnamed protein product, partial [Candidula unifasciata]
MIVFEAYVTPSPSITTSAITVPTTSSTSTLPTTPGSTATPYCEPLKSSLCSNFGYTKTTFPNLWGDKSAEEANKTYYSVAERSVSSGCSPNILFYVCSALFPSCEGDGEVKFPCTSFCAEVNESCPLLFHQNCDRISDPRLDHCVKPPPKITCQATEFACININKCVPKSAVCNKVNDCGDWSDERQCDCHPEFEIQCAMGLCVPSYYRCDQQVQCPDSSDEVGCECEKNQYKCEGGPCIMPEWLCDGQKDCPKEDDEGYCHNCSVDQFMCVDFSCIPSAEECDGIPQCADHTDEMNCIFKTEPNSAFFIKSDGDVIEVCTDGFTDAHGDTACLKMGEISLKNWTSVAGHGPSFFQLDPNGDHMSVIGKGKSVKRCSGNVVAVECNTKECGHPLENLPSFIINGQDALPGAWPWLVSVRKYTLHQCGGAIIHPYFILTAAHCIESSMDFTHMWIAAGTLRLSQLGPHGQMKKIRRVITYPGYKQLEGNDIALLELAEPLKYNDYIKPLCFPEKGDVFTRANRCYIAGWGHTKGVQGETSEHQQETKLTLWDTTKCNSSFVWNGRVQQSEMCAGYFNGLVAACSGDSGSPVACQDETKTWKVVGVASYVYKTCSVATKPLVFTDTSLYIDWINNHTVCQFTCGDGICLFDKKMLCDTVADCKDKSDEIDLCDVSANCSFTEKFVCGYQSKWQLTSSRGTDSDNRFPLFDHTIGNFRGMYLLGNSRGDDLISPRIDINTSHCMRFHYHMRGRVDQGMAVSAHSLDRKQWNTVWNVEQTIGPDRWLMGMFDLAPGNYDVVFRPHDNRRFALDDMWLIEGKCEKLDCFPGEFMCLTFEAKNCLPVASRCNIVVDCDNGEDEADCAAPAVYTCDFENGNICSLEQHTDDTTISEWIMTNSSNTPYHMPDHTFGNASGTLLKVKTEALLPRDQIFMSQQLNLRNMEHCLQFFYALTSPVTLQITLEWENKLKNLIKMTNRRTNGWLATQATLPAIGQTKFATLTYAVIGGTLGHWVEEQAIMLDDITITPGSCPPFICPAGFLLCEDEAYCVSQDKICDRQIDCSRSTDENHCECTESEFKCPNGPCIPKEKMCDLTRHCPDGSDEGTICDVKNSVSCDFEDAFLCGYKVNTSQTVFHWAHARGKTGDAYTGPSSDHTSIVNDMLNGHYVIADSQLHGNYSSLESIPFVSTGTGLEFYYHAWYFLTSELMTGRLLLIVTFKDNGTQIQLWSAEPNNQDVWKFVCLDLPLGNISISFVAHRGSSFRANIAVDDILLLDTNCSNSHT